MNSRTVRISGGMYEEVQTASRVTGKSAGELLQQAWDGYRESPEFLEEFSAAQKAFASGDLDAVTERLRRDSEERARRRNDSAARQPED